MTFKTPKKLNRNLLMMPRDALRNFDCQSRKSGSEQDPVGVIVRFCVLDESDHWCVTVFCFLVILRIRIYVHCNLWLLLTGILFITFVGKYFWIDHEANCLPASVSETWHQNLQTSKRANLDSNHELYVFLDKSKLIP